MGLLGMISSGISSLGIGNLEKYVSEHANCLYPKGEVKIGSKKWSSDDIVMTHVDVVSSVKGEASTCEVTLILPFSDYEEGKRKLHSDFSKVKVGVEVEVSLGYIVDKDFELESVFKGYVSAFEIEIDNKGRTILNLQGMDAKMWMMTNRKTELKKEIKKYSVVVSNVCDDYSSKLSGKEVDIDGEVGFEAPIYQRNESDYEFLSRISILTGSLFFIDLGKLYFVSPSSLNVSKLKLCPGSAISNIKLCANIWGIPKTVKVVGVDQKDKNSLIEAEASKSDSIGDGKGAASLTSNIGKANTIVIVDNTITSVNEAKFLAESVYNRRELNLMEVKLEIIGYPKVNLGSEVTLDNFGKPIDNDYIISGIEHHCNLDNAEIGGAKYTTTIILSTNRLNPQ